MRKHFWIPTLVLALTAGTVWAAKAKPAPKKAQSVAYPATMQAVGTFDQAKPSARIVITASPDESEPAAFIIKSPKALTGVTVKLGQGLVAGKSGIPVASINISALDENRLMPVRAFDLRPGEVKRFWVRFSVPAKTGPGTYAGSLVAVSGGKTVGKLPVELTVLPMRLLNSCKQYGVLLPDATVVDDCYKGLLSSIKASRFVMASAAVPPERLGDALRAINQAGLGTPVPYLFSSIDAAAISDYENQARAAGVRRMLYNTAYEPTTPEQIEAASGTIEAIRRAKLRSFAVINDPAAFDRLSDSLDTIAVSVDLPYIQKLFAGEKRTCNRNEWLYWDTSKDAKDNRLYAGFLLWKTGLDGIMPPLALAAETPGAAPQSVVGTVQWEAIREGIDDTRYATTLMAALREVKDALKVNGTKNSTLAQKTVDDTEAYLAAAFTKPFKDLNHSDYQMIRSKMANYTIALRKVLK